VATTALERNVVANLDRTGVDGQPLDHVSSGAPDQPTAYATPDTPRSVFL